MSAISSGKIAGDVSALTNGHALVTRNDRSDLEDDDDEGHNISYDMPQSELNGGVSIRSNGSAVKEIDRYGFFGGSQYTDPNAISQIPVGVLRKRELKWLDMLENWDRWMSKKFRKVKDRCRKGIPPSIRTRAWQYLSGSQFLMEQNAGRYEDYLRQPGNPQCIDDIQKDLDRQFPFHELFTARGGHGQEDLFNVLKAYSIHNPSDGYCQAQAPIAAVLLMQMPAEQAFWCFVSVCERYLIGYYSAGLEAVQIDGEVLFGLLKHVSPLTYKHLKKQKIEPILCMTEWFMCVFTRTLPWPSVLRLWDVFLCEGVKVMFRVALVLLKFTLGRPDQIAACPSLYETMERIRHIDASLMVDEFLMRECLRLPVTERDMEKEHQAQLIRWKANKEKNGRPSATALSSSTTSKSDKSEKGKKTKRKKHSESPSSPDS